MKLFTRIQTKLKARLTMKLVDKMGGGGNNDETKKRLVDACYKIAKQNKSECACERSPLLKRDNDERQMKHRFHFYFSRAHKNGFYSVASTKEGELSRVVVSRACGICEANGEHFNPNIKTNG